MMETAGLLSVLPPLLVVVLAITTKNIIFSLTLGLVCGLGIFGLTSPALESDNFLDLIMYGIIFCCFCFWRFWVVSLPF